jgi:hypothetical protein
MDHGPRDYGQNRKWKAESRNRVAGGSVRTAGPREHGTAGLRDDGTTGLQDYGLRTTGKQRAKGRDLAWREPRGVN